MVTLMSTLRSGVTLFLSASSGCQIVFITVLKKLWNYDKLITITNQVPSQFFAAVNIGLTSYCVFNYLDAWFFIRWKFNKSGMELPVCVRDSGNLKLQPVKSPVIAMTRGMKNEMVSVTEVYTKQTNHYKWNNMYVDFCHSRKDQPFVSDWNMIDR
jgi:hypothetical protein